MFNSLELFENLKKDFTLRNSVLEHFEQSFVYVKQQTKAFGELKTLRLVHDYNIPDDNLDRLFTVLD